jgi:YfiH family protein
VILQSQALAGHERIRHGFFGRQGGVSEGAWASLNVGMRSGDDLDNVVRNRAITVERVGAGADLVTARQVHGTTCLLVEEPWPLDRPPEADALVSAVPGLAVGVLTADCAPVLLVDPAAHVVGAAHAGWKGALAGIVEAVLRRMEVAGAQRARIIAAVGPCIAQRSYEVGPEFRDRFLEADPENERFFADAALSGRPHFDLEAFVLSRLAASGVTRIEALGRDTCAERDAFFSYRRACLMGERRFGLQLSAIAVAG